MKVLVVSPHPDDEALGCGGALVEHAKAGQEIRSIYLTSGEAGGHGADPSTVRASREAEAHDAARLLGISTLDFWRLPDGGLRSSDVLARRLRELLIDWAPESVYVPHGAEEHCDHRAASRLVRRAVRGLPPPRPAVWLFEVWTPLVRLDRIVDISEVIEAKLAAIRAYRSQCTILRFDEAFAGLARFRGEMHSWPGGPYAEVFQAMEA